MDQDATWYGIRPRSRQTVFDGDWESQLPFPERGMAKRSPISATPLEDFCPQTPCYVPNHGDRLTPTYAMPRRYHTERMDWTLDIDHRVLQGAGVGVRLKRP